MATPGKHVRWTEQEWFDVMTHFVAERDSTSNAKPICMEHAQAKALPKNRWRKASAFAGVSMSVARDYEMRFRAGWAPEGRGFTPPPAPAPYVDPATAAAGIEMPRHNSRNDVRAIEATFTAPGSVRWTGHEWALVCAATRHAIAQGDTRPLVRVIFHAQLRVLPLDRCRKINPLSAVGLAKLQESYDEGLRLAATLPKDVLAKIEGREAEYAAHLAKTQAGLAPPPAPAPAPERDDGPNYAKADEPEPEPVAAAAPVPAPVPAPMPSPAPFPLTDPMAAPLLAPARLPTDPLAARIALILADAATSIARESRAHVLAELDGRLDGIAANIARGIAASMRGEVQAILSAELGGPVSAPTFAPPLIVGTPPPPAPSTPTPETPPPAPRALSRDDDEWQPPEEATHEARDDALEVAMPPHARLKVDVVGDPRVMARALRDQTPDRIDVRLIEWEKARSTQWTPRPVVILSANVRAHMIQERARKKGSQLLMASAGPNSVVGLLHSLADAAAAEGETLQ